MRDPTNLSRLVEQIRPSSEASGRIWGKVRSRVITPAPFAEVVRSVQPSATLKTTLRHRILASITPPLGEALRGLSDKVTFPLRPLRFLDALQPMEKAPVYHAWLRWSAAFVLVVLAFRIAPLMVLSPTQADAAVQIIPSGKGVEMLVGGVWRSVEKSEVLTNAVMVRTDASSEATIVLNDDGVIRLASDTTMKLHSLGDRPQHVFAGPSATLVRGTVWTLGLLPPYVEGLTIETGHGILAINAGSTSIQEEGGTTTVSTFDRGVTFSTDTKSTLLAAGEKLTVSDTKALRVTKFSDRLFADAWPASNLAQDAVHRTEIAKLQEERQQKIAGILPGETLYPVKRVAETVDAFFAFTPDAKTEKQIAQAQTRLSEALALLKEGQATEAEAPLKEYTTSLVALAETGENSLVRDLLVRRIAEQSAAIDAESSDESAASMDLLKKAVDSVAAAVPNNTELALPELEGYLAVNQLALLRHELEAGSDPERVAALYSEVRPYLSALLSENHPPLRREVQSLLLATSTLAQSEAGKAPDQFLIALDTDVKLYLPEDAKAVAKATSQELDAQVVAMIVRIDKFRSPLQQYNQFISETVNIQGDPNEGTLLRRLQIQLSDRGFHTLAEYVNTALEDASNRAESR